ncbi:hypothetical protein ACIRYZ_00225 [Kitasatospora sp. NPDC101155]
MGTLSRREPAALVEEATVERLSELAAGGGRPKLTRARRVPRRPGHP